VLIAFELVIRSQLAWNKFGLDFFYKSFVDTYSKQPLYWDPVNGQFQRLAVPLWHAGFVISRVASGGSAGHRSCGVFDEMCPRWLRAPLAFITELLAAIPSVIYGLWAVFVLVPLLREHVNPWLISGFAGRASSATTTPQVLAYSRRA